MNRELLVNRVLDDEGLAGDLEEATAQVLVAWAVHEAEQIATTVRSEKAALAQVEALCRRARGCAGVVTTLFQQQDMAAAEALARKNKMPWPIADTATPEAARRGSHLSSPPL